MHASTHARARVPAHTQPLFAGLPAAAPPRPGCSSRVSMCCYLFHSGAIQGSDSSGRVPAPRPHAQPQSHCDRHSLLPAPPALCRGGGTRTQGCTRLRRCCLALGDVGDPWDDPPGTWSLLCFTLQRFMGLLGCLEPGHLGPLFAGGVLTSGLHPSLIHISPPKRGPPGPSGIWGCS